MTQSLFDPTGDQTAKGGSRYGPPPAEQSSHMSADLVDGKDPRPDAKVDPALVQAVEESERSSQ